jgi:hypothetical protein
MASRVELIGRWQSQLSESERLLFEGSSQLRWLRRMHVRLYRFLLSCYGHGDWRSDGSDESREEAPTSPAGTVFVDPSVHHGKQPKSAARIRATLKKVHVANDGRDKPGPLVDGLHNADWITVATLIGQYAPHKSLRLLKSKGITARLLWRGDDVLVQVPLGERQVAMAILESNREKLRTKGRASTTSDGTTVYVDNKARKLRIISSVSTTSPARQRFMSGLALGALVGPALMFFVLQELDATFQLSDGQAMRIFGLGWLICMLVGGAVFSLYKTRV